MIEILPNENDDKNFIRLVEKILLSEINSSQLDDVFIIKVDHWFDFKWRTFSHKIFGALGIWREPLRVPPFVPDRIVEELYFQNTNKSYQRKASSPLHINQPSAENAERKIKRNAAFYIWFSGETANNSQGSLMVYKFGKDFQNSWYVSFIKKSDWKIYKTDNISKPEINAMIKDDYATLSK